MGRLLGTKTSLQHRIGHRTSPILNSERRLAEMIDFFALLFFGSFSESTKEGIPLSDKSADDILEMLRCLFHTDSAKKPIDYENVAMLSKIADEYQIENLEVKTNQNIIILPLRVGNNLDFLNKNVSQEYPELFHLACESSYLYY